MSDRAESARLRERIPVGAQVGQPVALGVGDRVPDPPLQAGTVTEVAAGVVTVQLPGGGVVRARGSAAAGWSLRRDDRDHSAVKPASRTVGRAD